MSQNVFKMKAIMEFVAFVEHQTMCSQAGIDDLFVLLFPPLDSFHRKLVHSIAGQLQFVSFSIPIHTNSQCKAVVCFFRQSDSPHSGSNSSLVLSGEFDVQPEAMQSPDVSKGAIPKRPRSARHRPDAPHYVPPHKRGPNTTPTSPIGTAESNIATSARDYNLKSDPEICYYKDPSIMDEVSIPSVDSEYDSPNNMSRDRESSRSSDECGGIKLDRCGPTSDLLSSSSIMQLTARLEDFELPPSEDSDDIQQDNIEFQESISDPDLGQGQFLHTKDPLLFKSKSDSLLLKSHSDSLLLESIEEESGTYLDASDSIIPLTLSDEDVLESRFLAEELEARLYDEHVEALARQQGMLETEREMSSDYDDDASNEVKSVIEDIFEETFRICTRTRDGGPSADNVVAKEVGSDTDTESEDEVPDVSGVYNQPTLKPTVTRIISQEHDRMLCQERGRACFSPERKVVIMKNEKNLELDEQEEMNRAYENMNRKNKQIIKHSAQKSDVLIIDDQLPATTDALELECLDDDNHLTNWEDLFDENGEINGSYFQEITKIVGPCHVQCAKKDYSDYQKKDLTTLLKQMGHVIELYDFPASFKTADLIFVYKDFEESGCFIKWVDDTHALLVLSSPWQAQKALEIDHPMIRSRSIDLAAYSTLLCVKKWHKTLNPPTKRPPTCPEVAKRMVTGALGIKSLATRESREQERALIKNAKAKKQLTRKQQEDAWEGRTPQKDGTSGQND